MPQASTSTFSTASQSTSNGVTTGARRVLVVVIPTENATSPLHRYDIILLETPPGQHPTRIIPTIIGFGISIPTYPTPTVNDHAIRGMSENCAHVPIRMSHGRAARIRISSIVRVNPIVSMMNPSINDCMLPCTHEKSIGQKNVTTATAMIK
jgi:hypothetical protein